VTSRPRTPGDTRPGYARGVTTTPDHRGRPAEIPGLTVCSLCAGETLGGLDPLPGGQLVRLQRLQAHGSARLTLSECLDECNRGDVVIARPSSTGRANGARPVWFERLAGEQATDALARWLQDGGPGLAALPDELTSHVIRRAPSVEPAGPYGVEESHPNPLVECARP
jgi:(2Fe-2S) ferredoxin